MNEKKTGEIWLSPLSLGDGVSVQFRGDHIHVEMGRTSPTTPDRRDVIWGKIKKVSEEHGSKRVLVEGFVPDGERPPANVIAAAQRTDAVPNLWMAFHFHNFKPDENSELFKVIAASRGVRVKFFDDAEHALIWLRRNAPG